MSYEKALKHCQDAHAKRKKLETEGKQVDQRSLDVNNPEHWALVTGRGTMDTSAGISVNPNTALQSTAVFACIRVLSFSLAQLPLIVYKRLERGKERAENQPAYNLLHTQPNSEMSSFHWRATKMAHICLHGNAYSEIEFNGRGDPIAFWLIPAWRCMPVRIDTPREKKKLVYEVILPDGGHRFLLPSNILHIKSLSTDGMSGLSIIQQAAQSIGVSLAAQDFAARFYGQGMNIGGVAEHPGKLSETAYDRLKASLEEAHSGLSKSHRIMLLEEGMKFNKVGIPPEEAQFLESRQFQVVDIARMFGVPPHKIGDLSRATFSNIEHQAIEFVQDTMMPWFVNWEQELNRKLLDGEYFAEFLVEGLLRGDSVSRAQFYYQMFQMAALSPNDIREKENMNPVEHGDSYFVPLNLLPVSSEGADVKPEVIPVEESRYKEIRKTLSATRFRVAQSYRPVFEEAGKRIVAREVKNLRKEIKKDLGERSIDTLKTYLSDFYRDFQEYIIRQIKPVAMALADAIAPLAQDEVGQRAKTKVDTASFINEYSKAFASRYTSSSKGQIEALLKEEDYGEELEQRLTEWEEKRPGKIGMNETVQLSNAVAKLAFAGAGIQMLVWRNAGGKPCPYCQEMDGRKVGIDQDFVGYGSKLEAEGEGKLTVYRPCAQPPLHDGCECQLEPG